MKNRTLDEVERYVEEHFPGAEIAVENASENEDVVLTVRAGVLVYVLRVTAEFLEDSRPEEVKMILDWLDLAAELKRAEGLTMVLTEHGIKLESA